jgi:EAL domain-containing protein (putative c-di-GMP-specific phosphodiesterase class I)
MEHDAGPGDRKNSTGDYQLSLSDLEPAAGVTDCLDDIIFGLCDTNGTETLLYALQNDSETQGKNLNQAAVAAQHSFCNHLRHASNADTVYLCERQSLEVVTTTSVDFAEDTTAMHDALTAAISDLNTCNEAFLLPEIRVFPDQAKLSFAVFPLHTSDAIDTLAVVVDADEDFRDVNPCIATTVNAVYQAYREADGEPGLKQIHRLAFDQLRKTYNLCSERITSRRQEIFLDDLAHVTVHFEKVLSLVTAGSSVPTTTSQWGWQAVASLIENDQFPHTLYQQAELWGVAFTSALDTHLLREAAFRYKEVCEAANLTSFENIQPLSISVYPQTIVQQRYQETLQELIEMAVIKGPHVLLELSEKAGIDTTENASSLSQFKAQLQAWRDSTGVRIGLCEFGTGHSSLLRAGTLEPDTIKLSAAILPDRQQHPDDWTSTVTRLFHALTLALDCEPDSMQILIEGAQSPDAETELLPDDSDHELPVPGTIRPGTLAA